MRAKTTRAFRTISEAGQELGLQPHVLRFWESKFPDINPIKRGGGRRFYRPEDIEFIRGIKTLLYDEKHPIKDVQKLIAKSGAARIVDLGRSVEQASRDRDISDTTLVPPRIEKPDPASVKPVSEHEEEAGLESVEKTINETPESAPVPEETNLVQPVAKEPPRDLSSLKDALGRLEDLKSRWDEFDAAR